jgi:hypothetical protein
LTLTLLAITKSRVINAVDMWRRVNVTTGWYYVDIKRGAVLSNGRQYILPIKPLVYAIEWGFFTNEKDPRVILSYPT